MIKKARWKTKDFQDMTLQEQTLVLEPKPRLSPAKICIRKKLQNQR